MEEGPTGGRAEVHGPRFTFRCPSTPPPACPSAGVSPRPSLVLLEVSTSERRVSPVAVACWGSGWVPEWRLKSVFVDELRDFMFEPVSQPSSLYRCSTAAATENLSHQVMMSLLVCRMQKKIEA